MSPFDISKIEKELEKLENKTLEQNFWTDSKNSKIVLSKIKILKDKKDNFTKIEKELKNLEEMNEMLLVENDESLINDILVGTKKIEKDIENLEIKTLLSGKYDQNNAIITLHPGAGGTESQDWAEMLYRMYTRWATSHGYIVKELDYLEGDEAGIKSVTALIEGEYAYGYLKAEKGVHRLVRISPFDASGKRHTSFVSVDVTPELDDKIDVEINPNDLKIDTYRSSGAGGQHVNKTDSAVRITHIPTGIVVQCQNERSQFANKDTAMKMLKGKLIHLKELENKERIEDIQGKYSQITWGSQIRSYVFQPYKLVKDHRTNAEIGNVDSVMDGNINLFINEYLKMNKIKSQ